ATEPVDSAAKDGVDHGILPEDLAVQERLADRDLVAGEHAIAINPFASHPIEPSCDVEPPDGETRRSTLGDVDGLAAKAEAIFFELIAMAPDSEKHLAVEKAGFIEGNDAVAVGHKPNLVDHSQLDERN